MPAILSDLQQEVLKELMNIGANESANILSNMLNVQIDLDVPNIKVIHPKDLLGELAALGSQELTAVNMGFRSSLSGTSQLVFTQESANKLVQMFAQEVLQVDEFDEIKSGALVEIGNIILNAVLATFSNTFKNELEFFVPEYFENYKKEFYEKIVDYIDDVVLVGNTVFTIKELQVAGDIIIYLNVTSLDYFKELIDNYIKTII